MPVEGAKEAAVYRLRRFSEKLVGRERELEALVRTARVQRFVTCTGGEGIGKSAVALAAAERLASAGTFPGGVWLIAARSIASVDVLRRAAEGVPPGSLILLDGLDGILTPRREGALVWLDRLTGAQTGQQVLATAMEPIALEGERVLELDTMLEADGRRLLIAECEADIDADEAGALVRLLENNPRAIVLAAAMLSRLTPALLRRNLEGALLKSVGGEEHAPSPLTVLLGIGDEQPATTRQLLLRVGFAEEELEEDGAGSRLRLARRLLTQGWFDDALDQACDALALWQESGSLAGKAAATLLLARIAEAQGELARAVLVLEEAATLSRQLDDETGVAAARSHQGRIFTLLELPEAAAAALWEANTLRTNRRRDALFAELSAHPELGGEFLMDLKKDAARQRLQGLTAARVLLDETK
ncbi:MAG: hypothetical protein QM758_30150 [Armatimonas sp.]